MPLAFLAGMQPGRTHFPHHTTHRTARILAPLGLVLVASVLPAVAWGDTGVALREENARFVRLEGHLSSGFFGSNNFSTVGVGTGWDFTPYWGVEGYVGTGFPNKDQHSPGVELMGNFRLLPVVSASGRHAFTLTGGALGFVAGAWGPLAFVHTAVGYDLRLGGGLTAAATVGFDVALNDSREPDRKGGCALVCFGKPVNVYNGDVYPHVRLAVGRAF
jgi:hypothetical protein